MAAAVIKGINAKIRSNPVSDYLLSTHFWGPASNFGIPLAAILDSQKDPEIISGTMTGALAIYSGTFMRYSLAVSPRNYLLFACHFINCGSQLFQGYRYVNYWHYGGRDVALAAKVKDRGSVIAEEVKAGAKEIATRTKDAVSSAK